MTPGLAWPGAGGAAVGLVCLALLPSAGAEQSRQVRTHHQTWVCDVAYLPSRANWVRTVEVAFDDKRLQRVSVDGVAVHSFAVNGTVILTSQDNERIRLNVAQGGWESDFRGLASGQGRCEKAG
jgi:hypothetical protein